MAIKRQNKRPVGRPRDTQHTAQRRLDILRMATAVFAREGYRGTDVQVVADHLGIGKGTIYRYFPTKEALFLAAVDHGMLELKEQVVQARMSPADPLEQIREAIRLYLAYFEEHGDVIELIIQERAQFKDRKRSTYFIHQQASLDPWRALVQGLIDDGRIRPVPVDQILAILSDLMYGAIFTNRMSGRRKPFAQQADEMLDIVMRGILSEREQAMTNAPEPSPPRRRPGATQ